MMGNSNFNQEVSNVIKYCITEIMGVHSLDTIIEKSQLIDLTLDRAKKENKNIVNLKIDQQTTEINPNQIGNFNQRKENAKKKICESIIKKIIEEIPSKYSNLLSNDFEKISKTLFEYTKTPDKINTEFTKQQLEQLLQGLENPFVDITIDTLELITENNLPQIEGCCQFEFKKNAKQPVAIVSINPQLGQNPLMKIKFKIQGYIKFPRMKINDFKNFNILFGEFDATLGIAIQEIKVMDAGISGQDEEAMYTISERNIKYRLPEHENKENS